MDECWLDVTKSAALYGDGEEIAETIRHTVREELGLTVSIGVSFNKVFAKLGSDIKKPDAVTVIGKENFREILWPLPVSDLLFCGPATARKLMHRGIYTIGALALAAPELLFDLLGKNGRTLSVFANGGDTSPVLHKDFCSPIQSIGHGITCVSDLTGNEEVWKVILHLSQDIGHRLRAHEMYARNVQLTVKDRDLFRRQYQAPLAIASQSPLEIAREAQRLFERRYEWHSHVRALTVRGTQLVPASQPAQPGLFEDQERHDKQKRLDDAVEEIRRRFGKRAIYPAVLSGDLKLPGISAHDLILPGSTFNR